MSKPDPFKEHVEATVTELKPETVREREPWKFTPARAAEMARLGAETKRRKAEDRRAAEVEARRYIEACEEVAGERIGAMPPATAAALSYSVVTTILKDLHLGNYVPKTAIEAITVAEKMMNMGDRLSGVASKDKQVNADDRAAKLAEFGQIIEKRRAAKSS